MQAIMAILEMDAKLLIVKVNVNLPISCPYYHLKFMQAPAQIFCQCWQQFYWYMNT